MSSLRSFRFQKVKKSGSVSNGANGSSQGQGHGHGQAAPEGGGGAGGGIVVDNSNMYSVPGGVAALATGEPKGRRRRARLCLGMSLPVVSRLVGD